MKGKTLLVAALALALAGAVQANEAKDPVRDLWLHVNVHEADGGRVNVNLPMSVVAKAAAFLPDDAQHTGRVRLGDRDMSAADLREIWRAVKNGPDATYVTVDEKDGRVRVAKSGSYLLIRSDGTASRHSARGDQASQVDVRIPVAVVEALLSAGGDQLDVGAAIQALARQGNGELVTVNGDDDTVRIWIDAAAESR